MCGRAVIGMILLGGLLASLHHYSALAQASLVAGNTITGVSVQVKTPDGSDETQTFTLVRDARVPEQWYYFPNQPRLTENVIGGARIPELTLIRFTAPQSDGQITSAAILTFAVTLGASGEALEKLKSRLKQEVQYLAAIDPNNLRLSPIPINSASAAVYSPSTGGLVAEADSNSVVVPTDGNGKVVFAMKLNDVGGDVYKSLLDGTAGVPVWIKYNFNGTTPPAGFKVTVNWDQAYSFYSKDEKFRASASYFGWFSASASSDRTTIRDQLIQSGAVKVEAITGGTFSQEILDSYLQPIVKRLNDQLLQQLQPPSKIDPASVSTPSSSGFFGGAGYSVAVKDVSMVKKGSETWDFSFSSIIERAGAANGLVSVRTYTPEARKMAVMSVDAGQWDRVYYAMPRVPGGVDSATLRVRLRAADQVITDRYFNWKQSTGWVNAQGNQPLNGVWISLLAHADADKKTLVWDNSYDFSVGQFTVNSKVSIPIDGDAPLVSPSDLMRVIRTTGDGLEFESTSGVAKLVSVDISLHDGPRTGRQSFRLETVQGAKQVSSDFNWPVSSSKPGVPADVAAEVVFNYSGKPKCRVSISPAQFVQQFPADEVMLRLIAQDSCS